MNSNNPADPTTAQQNHNQVHTRRLTNVKYQPEHTKADYQTILENLNQAIKDAGLTKKAFAARAGMPYVMCAARLRGDISISAQELFIFADALEIPMTTFYVGVKAAPRTTTRKLGPHHIVQACMGLRNYSGVALAEHLQMSQSSLHQRSMGEVPFRVHELLEIATALDVPFQWFFEGFTELQVVPSVEDSSDVCHQELTYRSAPNWGNNA